MINNNDFHMLSFLSKASPGSNPFNELVKSEKNIYKYPKENTDSYNEEKEIRCPICLHRIITNAVRPNSCLHIYCLSCLKNWSIIKKECPLCKRSFHFFEKVRMNETWIKSDQCDVFA